VHNVNEKYTYESQVQHALFRKVLRKLTYSSLINENIFNSENDDLKLTTASHNFSKERHR